MTQTHIICNQDGHYWGRSKAWIDGSEAPRVATFDHRDEAVNTLVELSARDIDLRGEIKCIERIDNKLPKLPISDVPIPGADDETDSLALENEQNDTHNTLQTVLSET
ncbi:heat-shock protein HtpX [Luminiphilus syltensis]|nr:heat-shock protein HtpX [Luminiphilus syltensis]